MHTCLRAHTHAHKHQQNLSSSITHMCAVCVYSDEVPNDLSGRLYHLEVMLKQLNNDLERVRIFCSSQLVYFYFN